MTSQPDQSELLGTNRRPGLKKKLVTNEYQIIGYAYLAGSVFLGSLFVVDLGILVSAINSVGYWALTFGFVNISSRILARGSSEPDPTEEESLQVMVIVASTAAVSAFVFVVFVNLFITFQGLSMPREAALSKTYLYLVPWAAIAYAITWLHYYRKWRRESERGVESLKLEFNFWQEIIRGLLFLVGILLFSAAFGPTIGGQISPGEMILIAYTIVGVILFVFSPIVLIMFKIKDQVRRLEAR